MGIAFIKFLKWLISAGFFILGISLLQEFADTGDMKPVALVIFSFGVVFWLSKTTYEAPKNIFITTIIVLASAGILARLILDFAIIYYTAGDYYLAWFVITTVIGLPVMLYTFLKE